MTLYITFREGGFLDTNGDNVDQLVQASRAFTPVLPPRSITYADEDPEPAGIYEISHYDQPPVSLKLYTVIEG